MKKFYNKLLALVSKLESDKLLHCLLSLIFANFLATTMLKISDVLIAVIVTVILTNTLIIAKEAYDKKSYGLFSIADIVYGEIGMLIGMLLSLY